MQVSGLVASILSQKGGSVYSIAPDAMVYDAIQMMADKNVGALLVMKDEKLMGVISERDYTRKVILKGKLSKQTPVQEIMTSPVITVTPNHSIDECMRLISEKRVRHLPVVDGEKVVGVVSVGNLVNWIISAQNATINQLQNYISGGYA
ncbi:MAG: CBS domain-containing protein [Verrucomicrobiota bacterium]